MKKYIDIIVDVPVQQVDRPFTYELSESYDGQIKVGHKVLVPFGRQKVDGYVVGFQEQVEFAAKKIIKVFDDFTFFDNQLLELAKWIAEYYQCYLISAIKAIVPSGKLSIKKEKIINIAQPIEEIRRIRDSLNSRANKQKEILDFFIENNSDVKPTELMKRLNVGRSTINTLIDKGILISKDQEVKRSPHAGINFKSSLPLNPTPKQAIAINQINELLVEAKSKTILLNGVTGSGKTEVYLQAIAKALELGKEAIILVPEISLTPQTIARFKGRFGEQVAILHSQLSQGERFDEWLRIKFGQAKMVVGARSAIFAPFENLGLIIIDEEHESTYKQEDHPKYHAREVAVKRAELNNAITLLGTATPSLESYYRSKIGEYQLLELPNRVDHRPMPEVEVVDMREELKAGNMTIFSQKLHQGIIESLERKEQIVIFLNRRGFSTFVQCRECGHVMKCSSCDVSMTYHANPNILQCHYCDYKERVPDICPKCESIYIKYFGVGTQRVEEALNNTFPQARVVRMDVDTTRRKGAYQQILSSFRRGEIDILVGTQMIAKGHDFPNITLVGVITADTALNLPDFRAGERTFQLLTQVAGRTGRGDKQGRVIVQSYTPEHYSIEFAKTHDYKGFYDLEIEGRELAFYPPYSHLINITLSDASEETVIKTANQIGEIINYELDKIDNEDIQLLGPVQAPMAKVRGEYRWQMLLKGNPLEELRRIVSDSLEEYKENTNLKSIKVSVDVDPLGML